MIVKVSWTQHNRQYSIDLQAFLQTMGIDVTDAQLKNAVVKLLEQNEMQSDVESGI